MALAAPSMTGPSMEAEPINLFSSQANNAGNIAAFNQTPFTEQNRLNSGKHTRLGMQISAGKCAYGDVLDLKLTPSSDVVYSRKGFKLFFNPDTNFSHEFTITPSMTKYDLYAPTMDCLIQFFTKVADPQHLYMTEKFLGECRSSIDAQAKGGDYKSSVIAVSNATPLERYAGSRLLRFCEKLANAILSEAEIIWRYVEGIARKNGAQPVRKDTKGKSIVEKTIEKYKKDAAQQVVRDALVNNKEMHVKTKAMRQFSSLFYITPAEILETKIWYLRSLSGENPTQSKEVNDDLVQVLNCWRNFEKLNKKCANSGIYFPEVPFYVMDATGIWDISKSIKLTTFKPVSISSITGLRMPFLMGYNWQGNAIDGSAMEYVLISARIDKEIVSAKVSGLNALEQAMVYIAEDLFHFKNYPLSTLKRARTHVDKSIREYEADVGEQAGEEPLGPGYEYSKRFPPMQATNKVAQKFKESEENAKYYDDASKEYALQLERARAREAAAQRANTK